MARWEVTVEQTIKMPFRKYKGIGKVFIINYAKTQAQVTKAIRDAGIKGEIIKIRRA